MQNVDLLADLIQLLSSEFFQVDDLNSDFVGITLTVTHKDFSEGATTQHFTVYVVQAF